ncbi:MAG: hypothetical protein EOS73_05090 [Mesorhizobium sp.]|uniref:hypothetical protein n=1 Tax=Mesorhizobium sp. M7A.F.Ca.ET.027.02.1.1 TaxID=2496655 RepID=UPI000FD3C295|nr:hypothetical protein [Mesorhizobium sp. M7A.F.Ca.ET.027.02.1.1]RVD19429.1 hypothetical protein EN749_01150 [Mesorhizobium sp. M7A.F.Ca.ET.027.02.1.1]RWD11669.1 MAG: hypothetical protein EOS73_05090 [Mesorhizobium sp.]
MVKDAEAAGFNPLTAIRNGGSAGFTSTSTPGLSSGEFLADALKGVGQIVSSYDPMAKATSDLEFRIKQETLRNLQADTAQRLRASVGGVPASRGSSVVTSPGGMNHASAGSPMVPKVQQSNATNPYPVDTGAVINPNVPDAEAYENRYGDSEIGSMLAGGYVLARDLWEQASRAGPGTKLPGFGDRMFTIPPLRTGTYKPVRPTSRNSAGKQLYQSSPILPPSGW